MRNKSAFQKKKKKKVNPPTWHRCLTSLSWTCTCLIPLPPHLCIIIITCHFTLIALLLHLLLTLPRPHAQDPCWRHLDRPPSSPQASKRQHTPSLVTSFLCFKHLHFLFLFLFPHNQQTKWILWLHCHVGLLPATFFYFIFPSLLTNYS